MSVIDNVFNKRREIDYFLSLMTGDEKHEPSSISTLDVIWVLFEKILNLTPENVTSDLRDRFFLSKGHGPMALGSIYGLRARGITGPEHWVLMGDAELDEGSNFEAIAFAGRNSVSELNLIVIDNDSASLGWPGGVGHRFSVEGWEVSNVDGRDHAALFGAFKKSHPYKPHVIIASVETKSGKPRRSF